ncbi:MAG: hypothetical protein M3Y37_07600 [Chloroflexota bacterium]|nr:hypothetical protein [Chloroflexota bacterium]
MELRFGRYRLKLELAPRASAPCPEHVMDRDLTNRDLALLAQAEREYRDTLWAEQSILGSR